MNTSTMKTNALKLRVRPEFERELVDASAIGAAEIPLSPLQRLQNNTAFRRGAILIVMALIWQGYAVWLNNPLLFPTFSDTVTVMVRDFINGELLGRVMTSMRVLIIGYVIGVALAAVLTTLAVASRLGSDVLATLTAMFNPLPAIALLPLALIWFGLGMWSLVFVLVHGVLWAI
ncbi:MAG: ABC transporter permease, partial [Acidocella sp.]|nr:ABC transporter permease [Acidocella sp.]